MTKEKQDIIFCHICGENRIAMLMWEKKDKKKPTTCVSCIKTFLQSKKDKRKKILDAKRS